MVIRHRSAARRRAVSLFVGLAILIVLGGLSHIVGTSSLHAGEHERLVERSRLVQGLAGFSAIATNPDILRYSVSRTPFASDAPALNALLLQQFQVTPTGDRNILVALVDRKGRPIAVRPAGTEVPLASFGRFFDRALMGEAIQTSAFSFQGELRRALLIPVGLGGEPWGVLVTISDSVGGKEFAAKVGALNSHRGGLSAVDSNGIALMSWDPEQVGRRLIDPNEMAAIRAGQVRVWTTGSGSGQVTKIAAADPRTGDLVLFTQRSSDLFDDLQRQRRQQDLTGLGVLAAALAGLMWFGWRRERAARRAEMRLYNLVRNAHDLVLVVDADRNLSFVSPAIEVLLGHNAAEWHGRRVADLMHPDDVGRLLDLLDVSESGGTALDMRLATAAGATQWFDVEASNCFDHADLDGVLLTCHEVGPRKELQDQLGYQANHDQLTELPSRAVFLDRLNLALTAAPPRPPRLAVLFVDLDYFKPVNDRLGHAAGDQVLHTVATRLMPLVTGDDVVCRLGGDEFGVLLLDADEPTARQCADRIIEAIRCPIAVGTSLVRIDVSVGIAFTNGPVDSAERVIREADQAMYAAKRTGRGRHVVYVPGRFQPVQLPNLTALGRPRPERQETQPAAPRGGNAVGSSRASALPRRFAAFSTISRSNSSPRANRWLALLLTCALVSGVALFGLAQENHDQATADTQRTAERAQLTARVADYAGKVLDPKRLLTAASNTPWSTSDPRVNEAILRIFSGSPAAGPNSILALKSPDGRTLGAYPAGASTPIGPGHSTWSTALRGKAAYSTVTTVGGVDRAFQVIPVTRNGRLFAVLVIGQSLHDTITETFMKAVGSLGFGDGGLSLLDSNGRARLSWNPALIGQQLVDPVELTRAQPGQARQVQGVGDGHPTTLLAAVPGSTPDLGYLVFQQPTSVFFHDLRRGQLVRNLGLLLVVAVAMLGLGVLNTRREQILRRSESRLHALLHNAHDIVLVVDAHDRDGPTLFVSSAVETVLGFDPAASLGRPLIDLVHLDDRERLRDFLGLAVGSEKSSLQDLRLRTVDHDVRWFDILSADLSDRAEIGGILLTCHEIGERRFLQDQLDHQAHHDILTGLPNRAMFVNQLGLIARPENGRTFAVLFVDLDHFKPVNDTYGHSAGDDVLRTVADRLQTAIRHGDEGRAGDVVCRLGGDEFAVLLREADHEIARQAAERILRLLRQPISVDADSIHLGATIGIALSSHAPGDPHELVRCADHAMYRAKEAGRGRYTMYEMAAPGISRH